MDPNQPVQNPNANSGGMPTGTPAPADSGMPTETPATEAPTTPVVETPAAPVTEAPAPTGEQPADGGDQTPPATGGAM